MNISNKERNAKQGVQVKYMKRSEKTVITKDGYIIKKHILTLHKNRYYTITKDGKNKGWYTYKELFETLVFLRLFE